MRWLRRLSSSHLVALALGRSAKDALKVAEAFDSVRMVRTANSNDGLHLYVDPKFSGKYKINLHLMEQNDSERLAERKEEPKATAPDERAKAINEELDRRLEDLVRREALLDKKEALEKQALERKTIERKAMEEKKEDVQPQEVKTASSDDGPDEATISFPSKRASDPTYLCTVALMNPEKKLWTVSAYLMETYLGRYAFRADFYFRKDSAKNAKKCFERVARTMREIKQDVSDDNLLQNMVPRLIRKRLASIEGEIEPRVNRVATYLDPANKVEPIGPETSPANYLPNRRSLTDDVIMEK